MFKKSPSRNQRSKGVKIKNVLQICLLLGVCFWLIYQVKRSHDKRKEFDEKEAKASVEAETDDIILKFGRKDLPHVQEVSKNYKHEEDEEEENGLEEENKHDAEQEEKAKRIEEKEQDGASKHEDEEQEEASTHEEEEEKEKEEFSKHDDEEQEPEIKDEEMEEEGREDRDDEVDENEQERADGEADHGEESLDEEKEREAEDDGKENEEKENEEKEFQEEVDNLSIDQNHDGGGRNAHEGREEHYKADDASSAVSHDNHMINSEADKLDTENSNVHSTMNGSEQESKANTTEEINGDENKSHLNVDDGKHSEGGSSLNVTYTNENDHENGSSDSEYISLPNSKHTTDFIYQASYNSTEMSKETGNKPAEVNAGMPGSPQNGTAIIWKLTFAQHTTEDGIVTEEKYKELANETNSNSKLSDSIAVDSSKIEYVDSATIESLNSSTNGESGMLEDVPKINASAGGDTSGSSMNKETAGSTQNGKSEGDGQSGERDESSESSSSNETVDRVQHDFIDSSDNILSLGERDALVDLSTLPDNTTEGGNNEDAAAK